MQLASFADLIRAVEVTSSRTRAGLKAGTAPRAVLTVSGRQLTLALPGPVDDVLVTALRVARHAPDIDCRATTNGANANGRRVCGRDVLPSVPEVTDYGDSAHLDVD